MAVVLGPDITILKAQGVEGLILDSKANVADITSDKVEVLQALVDAYVGLGGQAVKDVIDLSFAKYPQIHPIK
jgi:hypothetical protein